MKNKEVLISMIDNEIKHLQICLNNADREEDELMKNIQDRINHIQTFYKEKVELHQKIKELEEMRLSLMNEDVEDSDNRR